MSRTGTKPVCVTEDGRVSQLSLEPWCSDRGSQTMGTWRPKQRDKHNEVVMEEGMRWKV
jgi:hypothetical protein